jgi:hypothetical protein
MVLSPFHFLHNLKVLPHFNPDLHSIYTLERMARQFSKAHAFGHNCSPGSGFVSSSGIVETHFLPGEGGPVTTVWADGDCGKVAQAIAGRHLQ